MMGDRVPSLLPRKSTTKMMMMTASAAADAVGPVAAKLENRCWSQRQRQ
jgi:hypothetical protein